MNGRLADDAAALWSFPYALRPFPCADADGAPPADRPASALLMATDAAGRALCQLRDEAPGVAFGVCWHLFGGAIDPGETRRAAARREFLEETGVALGAEDLTPFRVVASPPEAGRVLSIFRVVRPIAPAEIRLGEGAGFAFLTRAQIERLRFAPYGRLALLEAFDATAQP